MISASISKATAGGPTVGDGEGVHRDRGGARLALVAEAEVDVEQLVGHARGVDHQTVEGVQLRARPLRTVHRRTGAARKLRLDEPLAFLSRRERERHPRLQGYEQVVRVYRHVARLVQRSHRGRVGGAWSGRVGRGGRVGDRGRGSGGGGGPADGGLPGAGVAGLYLAVAAAGGVGVPSITGLPADDESIAALHDADAQGVGRVPGGGAGGALVGGGAGLAGAGAGEAAVGGVEVLSCGAVDGPEHHLGADPEVVLVVAVGTAAAADLRLVNGVQGAARAPALEVELARGAGQHADATAVEGVPQRADALPVRKHLVVPTRIAVPVAVQQLVRLTLAQAARTLQHLPLGAPAPAAAVVDRAPGAHRASAVEEEAVGEGRTDGADTAAVVGIAGLADTAAAGKFLVDSAAGAGAVRSGHGAGGTDGAGPADSAEAGQADALLGTGVVLLIGAALLGADAHLVGVVSVAAVASQGL
jgi:hypothetical protein